MISVRFVFLDDDSMPFIYGCCKLKLLSVQYDWGNARAKTDEGRSLSFRRNPDCEEQELNNSQQILPLSIERKFLRRRPFLL